MKHCILSLAQDRERYKGNQYNKLESDVQDSGKRLQTQRAWMRSYRNKTRSDTHGKQDVKKTQALVIWWINGAKEENDFFFFK